MRPMMPHRNSTQSSREEEESIPPNRPEMIRVIAPATLSEGYEFDVMVNNTPFTVQVPRGGVKEGQEFEVPYEPVRYHQDDSSKNYYQEDDDEDVEIATVPAQTMTEDEDDQRVEEQTLSYDSTSGAPMGRWRVGLCSCCDVVTQSTCWMGICCTPVLIAQLITRLGLTWNGRTGTPEEASLSFNRIVFGMMVVLGLWKIPVLGWFVLLAYYVFMVAHVGSHVRSAVRKRYKIPTSLPRRCCAKWLDDACCMCLCGCCSAIQMARHTHDDKEYPGHGCTTTGLGRDAPSLV